jgi:hypothetical protein
MSASAAQAVSRVPTLPFANRGLSQLQLAILEFLETKLPANIDPNESVYRYWGYNHRHCPRTGEIIDALGRRRDKAGFASVSRALKRLAKANLILCWYSNLSTPGSGANYSLNDPSVGGALQAGRAVLLAENPQ